MAEITDLLTDAAKAVEDAGVPDDLRAAAFGKAFDWIAGAPSTPAAAPADQPREHLSNGPISAIADRLNLSTDTIDQVYEVLPSGELQLVIPATRLDPTKARGAQQIAALVAFGRQAAGLDEANWTSIEHVRNACQDFNRYDEGNFASSVRAIEDLFSANVRGNGRSREIRMTRDSWPQVGALVRSLTGSTET